MPYPLLTLLSECNTPAVAAAAHAPTNVVMCMQPRVLTSRTACRPSLAAAPCLKYLWAPTSWAAAMVRASYQWQANDYLVTHTCQRKQRPVYSSRSTACCCCSHWLRRHGGSPRSRQAGPDAADCGRCLSCCLHIASCNGLLTCSVLHLSLLPAYCHTAYSETYLCNTVLGLTYV